MNDYFLYMSTFSCNHRIVASPANDIESSLRAHSSHGCGILHTCHVCCQSCVLKSSKFRSHYSRCVLWELSCDCTSGIDAAIQCASCRSSRSFSCVLHEPCIKLKHVLSSSCSLTSLHPHSARRICIGCKIVRTRVFP